MHDAELPRGNPRCWTAQRRDCPGRLCFGRTHLTGGSRCRAPAQHLVQVQRTGTVSSAHVRRGRLNTGCEMQRGPSSPGTPAHAPPLRPRGAATLFRTARRPSSRADRRPRAAPAQRGIGRGSALPTRPYRRAPLRPARTRSRRSRVRDRCREAPLPALGAVGSTRARHNVPRSERHAFRTSHGLSPDGYPLDSSAQSAGACGMNVERQPVSGLDFPATFEQFVAWFATEEACPQYSARARRVHLPLQSQDVGLTPPPLLPPRSAGRGDRSRTVPRVGGREEADQPPAVGPT